MFDTASEVVKLIVWLINYFADAGRVLGFAGEWGVVRMTLVAGVFWAALFLDSHRHCDSQMRSNQVVKERWSLRFFKRWRERRWAMGPELAANHQKIIVVASSVILLLSLTRALGSGFPDEFSRAGALISIVGLWGTIASYLEGRAIQQRWAALATHATPEDREAILANASQPTSHAQFRAAKVSVAVALIGNLIWGYGDQALACGVLHPLSIPESGDINCIKSR